MPDPYDAHRDARSEARYDDDRAEPTLEETKRDSYYGCIVDESAGLEEHRIR